ncbi:hypothetical protein PLESTF_000430100 [Pleodorina starrii]|nr:hypothetical protein PLESTF_000430100 [Pleodorina starrii]
MPPLAEPAEVTEAQRLLETLHKLISNVGEAYVELSGQTAATQAVVADLRRCGSFLHNRLVGEPPPAPWLSASARGASSHASLAATPPARRASFSQPLLHPAHTRDPPPTGKRPGVSKRYTRWRWRNPRWVSEPAAGASITSSSSRSAGRAGFNGRGPQPRSAVHTITSSSGSSGISSGGSSIQPATACRARDPSPQRRAGVGPGPAATPLRSASPAGVATPQARGQAPAPSPAGPARGGPCAADQGAADGAVGGGAGGSRGSSSSHLPLAAQRALAAAAALGGGPDGSAVRDYHCSDQQQHQHQQHGDAAEPKAAGPPQLPLALRRAMQRYRDTLQTRDQLLQQSQQRRGNGSSNGAGSSGGPSLADTVAAAGHSYRAALARQYPSTSTSASAGHQNAAQLSGGVGAVGAASQAAAQLGRMSLSGPSSRPSAAAGAPLSPSSTAALQRRAQVVFAALVAAQTWLIQFLPIPAIMIRRLHCISDLDLDLGMAVDPDLDMALALDLDLDLQSLTDLARSRVTPGGVAAANRRASQADTCAALLADVELLRLELDDLQQQLKATASEQQQQQQQQQRLPGPPSTAAAAAAAGMCALVGSSSGAGGGLDGALAGVAAGLGIDREELEEAAALWRNRFLRALLLGDPAGPGHGGRRGQGGGPGGPSQRQAVQQQPGLDGLGTGPSMRRPLGFWLPDAMWAHAPLPGDETAASSNSVPPHSPAGLSAGRLAPSAAAGEPSWQLLLPHAPAHPNTPLVPAPARRAAAPPALMCASAQDAVAHGRAQLQLQSTVFQLLLEGSLAAPLLPRQRPRQPPPAAADRGWPHHHHHHHHHRQFQQQQHLAAAVTWERWLAQCRLAHLLLFKGAWNRLCSVVELEEEEVEEGQYGDEADG